MMSDDTSRLFYMRAIDVYIHAQQAKARKDFVAMRVHYYMLLRL